MTHFLTARIMPTINLPLPYPLEISSVGGSPGKAGHCLDELLNLLCMEKMANANRN